MARYNFTKTAADVALLSNEITDAGLPESIGMQFSSPNLIIGFTNSLTSGQETTLSTVVSDHDHEPLDKVKDLKYREFIAHTNHLRNLGFRYNGKTFSLLEEDVQYWHLLKSAKDTNILTFPTPGVTVSTVDDEAVDIVIATDLDDFFEAMFNTLHGYIEGEADLKGQVFSASDKTTANAVTDNR